MRDTGLIVSGLAVFLAAITFPAWYDIAAGKTSKGPDPRLPAREKQCVAPVAYMRSSHMDLLLSWREDVVRRGIRRFTAFDGRTYDIGMTSTCLMKCHTSKAEFCDRCHNYVGVQGPYCFECHIDPKQLVARRTE